MMQNRYDRNQDPDHFAARRDDRDSDGNYNRDEDDRRYGERGDPWRSGEAASRAYPRHWSNREGSMQNYPGRWQNASGRFRERDDDDQHRSSWEAEGRRSRGEDDWYSRTPQNLGARRYPEVRGYYQEQRWARDPNTGNLYGYEYSAPIGRRSSERDDTLRGSGGTTNRLGSHYGKGPKGYVLSDERIREDVCDRLSDDDEVDAGEISVSVKDGEVTLEGSVSDRHSKHRAEDIAESVSGVREVTNKLRAKKSFIRELGDKLSGDDELEHRGHTGSGTRNSPSGIGNRGAQSH
jgi:hypothetical protein